MFGITNYAGFIATAWVFSVMSGPGLSGGLTAIGNLLQNTKIAPCAAGVFLIGFGIELITN